MIAKSLAGQPSVPPEPGRPRPLAAAFWALFVVMGCGQAQAKPLVSVFWDGRGGFTVMGNQLQRVSMVELQLAYRSADQATPQFIRRGHGAKAAIEVDGDSVGILKARVTSDTPMSGHVTLASVAPLAGVVTHATAWLRNDKGAMESADVRIVNPTEEQLETLEGRRCKAEAAAPALPAEPAAGADAVSRPVEARDLAASVMAGKVETRTIPPSLQEPSAPALMRRQSVLELFKVNGGSVGEADLAALLRRADEMFSQEPPVLLSDGAASLTVSILAPGDQSLRFLIYNGDCTRLRIGEKGEWLLDIVPVRGALEASVTVLTDEATVEFPLAVSPPLEHFDAAAAPEAADYVAAANRLARGARSAGYPLAP